MEFTRITGDEVVLDIGTNLKILSGNSIKFRCPLIVKNKDNVDILWFMDNRRLVEGKLYQFAGNTLVVKDTAKAKVAYVSCVARAPLGTAKRTSRLEIIGKQD